MMFRSGSYSEKPDEQIWDTTLQRAHGACVDLAHTHLLRAATCRGSILNSAYEGC